MCFASDVTVKYGRRLCVLSIAATLITLLPTAGAELPYKPIDASLPADATTTTPLFTSRVLACAVGYSGHWRDDPMLILTTCIPSASARSIAASMMSVVVGPSHPNTRYAPNVTP